MPCRACTRNPCLAACTAGRSRPTPARSLARLFMFAAVLSLAPCSLYVPHPHRASTPVSPTVHFGARAVSFRFLPLQAMQASKILGRPSRLYPSKNLLQLHSLFTRRTPYPLPHFRFAKCVVCFFPLRPNQTIFLRGLFLTPFLVR